MGSDYLPIAGQRLQCLFRLHTLLSCRRRCLSLAYCRVRILLSVHFCVVLFRKYNRSNNALITVTGTDTQMEFYFHVTVHRDIFLYNKTNQMHEFPKFTLA